MSDAIARLLDANANRAREGLRVMEDHARFILCDSAMAERVKQIRHELSAIFDLPLSKSLMASRDAAGDVGRTISTSQEASRANPEEVLFAAARRVTEALRCLEEHSKHLDRQRAAEIEAIRYLAYELEQRLMIG